MLTDEQVHDIRRLRDEWRKYMGTPHGFESLCGIAGILAEWPRSYEGYGPNLRDLMEHIADTHDMARSARLVRISEQFRDSITEAAQALIVKHKLPPAAKRV